MKLNRNELAKTALTVGQPVKNVEINHLPDLLEVRCC